MNLFIRFLFLVLKRLLWRAPIGAFDACVSHFRVNPLDLDMNLHMNNGRYLSIMDLGRIDLMLRAGTFWPLVRGGYYPVIVSESIRFRRSLEPFQAFTLVTQIVAWDEKDFFIQQRFQRGETVMASAVVRARFRKRGKKESASPSQVFDFVQQTLGPARLTELARRHLELDASLD